MTDREFNSLLKKTAKKLGEYQSLLLLAEEEYERRYGVNPCDADDDTWIDSLRVSPSPLTVKQVEESVNLRGIGV